MRTCLLHAEKNRSAMTTSHPKIVSLKTFSEDSSFDTKMRAPPPRVSLSARKHWNLFWWSSSEELKSSVSQVSVDLFFGTIYVLNIFCNFLRYTVSKEDKRRLMNEKIMFFFMLSFITASIFVIWFCLLLILSNFPGGAPRFLFHCTLRSLTSYILQMKNYLLLHDSEILSLTYSCGLIH